MDQVVAQKVANFFKSFKRQTYKKGEILVRADEDPSGIFYLTEGIVKQYAISARGEELIVNLFKPFAFFPMSWAINQTPNAYYFEAETALEVWKAPREEAVNFVKTNPDVMFDLLSRVYKGTDGMLSRTVNLMSGEAYARVVTEIIITAKRFGKSHNRNIELSISEKELANQAGMARETISREIKTLKEKGLVSFSQNLLVIPDLDRLAQEIN